MRALLSFVLVLAVFFCHLDPTSGAVRRKVLKPQRRTTSFGDFVQPITGKLFCKELDPETLAELLGAAYNPRYMSIEKPEPSTTSGNDENSNLEKVETVPELSTTAARNLDDNVAKIFDDDDDSEAQFRKFENSTTEIPELSTKNPESKQKRKAIYRDNSFVVDSDFHDVIDDNPAWDLDNHLGHAEGESVQRSLMDTRNVRPKRDVDFAEEWHCKSRIVWTDLGPDYYPRYLRSVECLKKNCWFQLYHCVPRSFTVKILRRRRGMCVLADKEVTKVSNFGLPNELTELWVWEERAISFCCDCSRNTNQYL